MKSNFQYQKLSLRIVGALIVAFLVYLFQITILHNMSISNAIIYSLDTLMMILSLSLYYGITHKQKWYIKKGDYSIEKDIICFNLNKKTIIIPFDDINEIFMCKNNSLGSHFVILQIKWSGRILKLYSPPIDKSCELYETEFMDIFKDLDSNSNTLQFIKDNWGNDTDYRLKSFS